jgi:hypothetical protein
MGQPSIYYDSAPLSTADSYTMRFIYTASATPQLTPVPANAATIFSGISGATLITNDAAGQAKIDGFLGTSSEFLVAQVASVGGGNNAAGSVIINLSGQSKMATGGKVTRFGTTGSFAAADQVFLLPVTALPDIAGAVPTVNNIATGANGNIALTYVMPSAVLAGQYLMIEVYFYPQ